MINDLRAKYPNAQHEPNPLCPMCCGAGEYPTLIAWHKRVVPCACIFHVGQSVAIIHKLLNVSSMWKG